MAEPLRLLAILPHPDDETLAMGGTLARYAAEGVATFLVCATRGERGWTGPAAENPGPAAVGQMREAELRCAASHLGLREVAFLDCVDGEVDQADPQVIIASLVAHIRRIRPQVVVTFALDGAYGHPDHIALAQFVGAAIPGATGGSDEGGLPPWRVSKFYYVVDSRQLVADYTALAGPLTIEVDGVVRQHVGWEAWAVTTRIDTRDHFDAVWAALHCHHSQLASFAPLLAAPRETVQRMLGEGTFVRAFSTVNGGRTVEHDLFEGLRS